jgi:TRAF3-interacting protein 1
VIYGIFTATGFGEGLLDETETDSAALKDKSAKIAFLEKVCNLVGMQLNTMIDARPAKIVSGLEPENTNRLLQVDVWRGTAGSGP